MFKSKVMKSFLFYIILISIYSCSSAQKSTAVKLTEQGMCKEALPYWMSAQKEDPNDVEIQIGIKKCREQMVNDNLVKIRDLRISGKTREAISELFVLKDKLSQWSMSLDYNSSSFQGKEINALWFVFKDNLDSLIKKNMVLKVALELKKHESIFGDIKDFSSLREKNKLIGQSVCEEQIKRSLNKFFYLNFTKQFCLYFNPNKNMNFSSPLPESLFGSSFILSDGIKGVNKVMIDSLTNKAMKAVTSTPWYEPSVKDNDLIIKLDGFYKERIHDDEFMMHHNYSVVVNYTEIVPVTRTIRTPITRSRQVCSTVNGFYSCNYQPYTTYTTRTYTENVKQQRSRSEPRTFSFVAVNRRQEVEFSLNGILILNKDSIPISFTKKLFDEKKLHGQNRPDIGLYPLSKDIKSSQEVFDSLLEREIIPYIQKELNQFWSKKYCTSKWESLSEFGDLVMRCRRSTLHDKVFVDNWFQKNFGISDSEAVSLIGQF